MTTMQKIKVLKKRIRKDSLAWDVIFYRKIGTTVTVALKGKEEMVMRFARLQKKDHGYTKWISIPYPEFNHRYNGVLELASNPSWGLLRKPNQ